MFIFSVLFFFNSGFYLYPRLPLNLPSQQSPSCQKYMCELSHQTRLPIFFVFYIQWLTCNDLCSPLKYHVESFHSPQSSIFFLVTLPPSPPLSSSDLPPFSMVVLLHFLIQPAGLYRYWWVECITWKLLLRNSYGFMLFLSVGSLFFILSHIHIWLILLHIIDSFQLTFFF